VKSESLFQELILQHYRKPRNRGGLTSPDAEVAISNPICGDEIVLRLRLDGIFIEELRFTGHGCAISQASASMMAQQVEGKTLAEARDLSARFARMMQGDPEPAADRELGDLRALAGLSRFPVRVRCAILAWDALAQAIRPLGGDLAREQEEAR